MGVRTAERMTAVIIGELSLIMGEAAMLTIVRTLLAIEGERCCRRRLLLPLTQPFGSGRNTRLVFDQIVPNFAGATPAVTISERKKEIKRRRHRRQKVALLKRRSAKATVSEKQAIAHKLRELTPGAEVVIAKLGLEER